MNPIQVLMRWYSSCCDGDWEHSHGIYIKTLDNPGWRVDIDLVGTWLETCAFERGASERSDTDWIACSVQDGVFKGRGGPKNLEELLSVFVQWMEANPPPSSR